MGLAMPDATAADVPGAIRRKPFLGDGFRRPCRANEDDLAEDDVAEDDVVKTTWLKAMWLKTM
jgi:hypothetical protein